MTLSAPTTHQTAETRLVEAAGVNFAYRRFGRPTGLPLVLLHTSEATWRTGIPR
jgi:hypothetical protein